MAIGACEIHHSSPGRVERTHPEIGISCPQFSYLLFLLKRKYLLNFVVEWLERRSSRTVRWGCRVAAAVVRYRSLFEGPMIYVVCPPHRTVWVPRETYRLAAVCGDATV